MKHGIITCRGESFGKNIGDYVQTIAARVFAGKDAVFLEREELDSYAGEPVKVAMNAWFMHHPDRFPPSPAIHPLFVSFHLRPAVYDRFFTPESIAYLRTYAPIGCRDLATVKAMTQHGIPAVFTSCVTLALGECVKRGQVSGPPVFVDPYSYRLPRGKLHFRDLVRCLKVLPYFLCHGYTIVRLARKLKVFRYWPRNGNVLCRWYHATEFLRGYSPVFSSAFLLSAEYVTHKVLKNGEDEAGMIRRAEDLLRRYASAPFVITSRLHCALPCLSMGVPVVVPYHRRMSAGRFDGNLDLLNHVDFDESMRLVRPDWLTTADGRIHSAADLPARSEWRRFAENLSRTCRRFFSEGD